MKKIDHKLVESDVSLSTQQNTNLIIVPTYNEVQNIEILVNDILKA